MDVAVAVALIFAGLALGIAIGAILLALRAGRADGVVGGGIRGTTDGPTTDHYKYSFALDKWFRKDLIRYIEDHRQVIIRMHPDELGDPGIKDPPTPPAGP